MIHLNMLFSVSYLIERFYEAHIKSLYSIAFFVPLLLNQCIQNMHVQTFAIKSQSHI